METAVQARLRRWYAQNARTLPWRQPPGAAERADPYRVWLSEVMLQQTTVAAVIPYFHRFTDCWPDVHALAAAPEDAVLAEWAGLGYYARARNLIRCARAVCAAGGRFPEDEAGLLALPGIGPYTAAAIAAIAFDRPEVVVDGNVERVMARLFAVSTPLPAAKPALRDRAAALTPRRRPGDHAQAVMDLGATVCTPKSPRCPKCPLADLCAARREGAPERYPLRAPRAPKPQRHGTAYLLRRSDGAVLLERRPESGLLGGMLGLPGTAWREAPADPAPPIAAEWREAGTVHHVFTHFRLELRVLAAELDGAAAPDIGRFRQPDRRALPSVMRKALDIGLAGLKGNGPPD